MLGACLLDDRVYLQMAGTLRGSDFFYARHQHIWEAFERLAERKHPAADYLVRAG